MRRTLNILLATIVCCLGFQAAHADIYQYIDENGVVHFTNVNGGGKNHKKIKSEQKKSAEADTSGQAPAAAPAAAPPAAPSAAPKPVSSVNIPSAYLDIIDAACAKHGVDPSLVHAIVKVESDFNTYALSRKGAMGLMQLMPQTAVEMNVKNSFSPHENIEGGVRYLRYLMDRYEGNLSLALAAYNAGETAVQRWGTVPPFKETQNYVKKILRLYNGKGSTLATRYTIYIGYGEDGSLLLTDNPSNHQKKSLKRKTPQAQGL